MARDAVLVIDDDADFRESLRMLLEDQGLAVLEAVDGAEAVALVEREGARVRLVLLDYWMPGMKPAECARALEARLAADVPIVLVTAAANPAERAAEVGLERYMSKPFTVELLGRMVSLSART
jgi:CheY-like chemotaxis protein